MNTMKEKDVMNEMERKPYSSESMRVRCPQCRKLYMVQFSDVKEAKPRFECIQCHSRFWLSLPDMDLASELIGLPMQVKEAPAKVKTTCPKCFKAVEAGKTECGHCGIVVAKWKELNFLESGPPRSTELNGAWKKVLANYGDESLHSEFIKLAQHEGNLPYAAIQYGQMQNLMPTDDTTKKRVREVQALGSVLTVKDQTSLPRTPVLRLWQIPLVVSVLMMLVGMVLPVFRNIVGVGAAFFFLALALQLQFGRRK